MQTPENAIYFRKNVLVGLPPAGAVVLLFDANGNAVVMDSSGNQTQLGSSAVATSTSNGLMPAAAYAQTLKQGANLTDANATINPATDKASLYVLPANTLTADRQLTLGLGGSPAVGHCPAILVQPQTHNLGVYNDSAGLLFTFTASTQAMQALFYFNGAGHYTYNVFNYVNN